VASAISATGNRSSSSSNIFSTITDSKGIVPVQIAQRLNVTRVYVYKVLGRRSPLDQIRRLLPKLTAEEKQELRRQLWQTGINKST
jgi:hypothetical protein